MAKYVSPMLEEIKLSVTDVIMASTGDVETGENELPFSPASVGEVQSQGPNYQSLV